MGGRARGWIVEQQRIGTGRRRMLPCPGPNQRCRSTWGDAGAQVERAKVDPAREPRIAASSKRKAKPAAFAMVSALLAASTTGAPAGGIAT